MKKSKQQQRVAWCAEHRAKIEAVIPDDLHYCGIRGGSNAANIPGWSGGGWGWWYNAMREAGVSVRSLNYWSGQAPTPSTAIPETVAYYIKQHAPKELL